RYTVPQPARRGNLIFPPHPPLLDPVWVKEPFRGAERSSPNYCDVQFPLFWGWVMFRKCIATVTALALVCLGVGLMTVQTSSAKPDREADKAAIDKLIKSSVQAFNNRDAAALAANWTEEGEYTRNDGEAVHGRAEI